MIVLRIGRIDVERSNRLHEESLGLRGKLRNVLMVG